MNGWHRPVYDECRTTLPTHHGFSINPLDSITLTIMVGPKEVSSIFTIIRESDIFQVRLGIPWLITMEVVPLLVHKWLKLPHEGAMHVIQDTGYRPLIAYGDFSMDHFWPSLVGPMLPPGDLLYYAYYKYEGGVSFYIHAACHIFVSSYINFCT